MRTRDEIVADLHAAQRMLGEWQDHFRKNPDSYDASAIEYWKAQVEQFKRELDATVQESK